MKTKYSTSCTLMLLIGSALFFTSCTKEDLQAPQAINNNSGDQMHLAAANIESITANPKFPSPDTGLNLIPNGLYFITWMGQTSIRPELKRVIEVTFPFWTIMQEQVSNRSSQWWYVTNLGNGYYSIINYFDKSALEAEVYGELSWPTGGMRNPTQIYSGRQTQQWCIATSARTGHSRLYNRQTRMAAYWQDGYPSDVFMRWAGNWDSAHGGILAESWKFIPKQ